MAQFLVPCQSIRLPLDEIRLGCIVWPHQFATPCSPWTATNPAEHITLCGIIRICLSSVGCESVVIKGQQLSTRHHGLFLGNQACSVHLCDANLAHGGGRKHKVSDGALQKQLSPVQSHSSQVPVRSS